MFKIQRSTGKDLSHFITHVSPWHPSQAQQSHWKCEGVVSNLTFRNAPLPFDFLLLTGIAGMSCFSFFLYIKICIPLRVPDCKRFAWLRMYHCMHAGIFAAPIDMVNIFASCASHMIHQHDDSAIPRGSHTFFDVTQVHTHFYNILDNVCTLNFFRPKLSIHYSHTAHISWLIFYSSRLVSHSSRIVCRKT